MQHAPLLIEGGELDEEAEQREVWASLLMLVTPPQIRGRRWRDEGGYLDKKGFTIVLSGSFCKKVLFPKIWEVF